MQPARTEPDYQEVFTFWFGALDPDGHADEAHTRRWFTKDPAFDDAIRRRFGTLHRAVTQGDRDEWLVVPSGRLAFIIVHDQFSRNMFRDTAEMFAHDAPALRAALGGIAAGVERALAPDERSFFYMPLMHSEALAVQDQNVALLTAWQREVNGGEAQRIAGTLKYAEQHRDIIGRFGRFPHRNALLGRPSTAAELEFLRGPGSSF